MTDLERRIQQYLRERERPLSDSDVRRIIGHPGGRVQVEPLPTIQVTMLYGEEVADFTSRVEQAHRLTARSKLVFKGV